MATQEITTVATKDINRALSDASLALGKAWGLAYVCCTINEEGMDPSFDIEGVLRSVHHQIRSAAEKVKDVNSVGLAVGEALAVCELVMVDSYETSYGIDSPSMWALEALPDALRRAKDAVDAAHLPVKG